MNLQWVYCKLYYFHCSLPRAASWIKSSASGFEILQSAAWGRSPTFLVNTERFFLLRWRVSTWIFWGIMKTIENQLVHIHETTWITMVLCFFLWGWLVNIHESLLVQGIPCYARSSRGAISMPWFVVNNISQNSAPQKSGFVTMAPCTSWSFRKMQHIPFCWGS